MKKYLPGRFLRAGHGRVDDKIRVLRGLIRVLDARDPLEDSGLGLGVEALSVPIHADGKGSGEIDLDVAPIAGDVFPILAAAFFIRGDRGADGDSAVFCDFACDKSDPEDVQVPVFPGKSEFAREVSPDDVTVKEGNGPVSHFQEFGLEDAGKGGFAGPREPGEKDRESLSASGGIGPPDLGQDIRVDIPGGDVVPLFEASSEFAVGEAARKGGVSGQILGEVFVSVLEICKRGQWHHGNAAFLFKPLAEFTGGEPGIVGAPVHGGEGICVVRFHHHVGAAVVFVDDGELDGLPRSGEAHGVGEEVQVRKTLGQGADKGLMAPDPGEVVDVAGASVSGHGVKKDVQTVFLGKRREKGPDALVKDLAGGDGKDLRPARPVEKGPELCRCEAQGPIVEVHGKGETGDRAGDEDRPFILEDAGDPRVRELVRRIELAGLEFSIRPPDLLHVEDREHEALGVPKRGRVPGARRSAVFSDTARTTGRGQRVPSARRIPSRTFS